MEGFLQGWMQADPAGAIEYAIANHASRSSPSLRAVARQRVFQGTREENYELAARITEAKRRRSEPSPGPPCDGKGAVRRLPPGCRMSDVPAGKERTKVVEQLLAAVVNPHAKLEPGFLAALKEITATESRLSEEAVKQRDKLFGTAAAGTGP